MVKIFVGRLAETVTRDELQSLFEKYGEVSDCDILRDYGFVHMADESQALKAIRELDRLELYGSRISVELSTSRSMKSCQLTISNLPQGSSPADIHKIFKKFGTVTLCRISGMQAAVHMRWASMAAQALRSLNGQRYKGNILSVQFATNANEIKEEWPTSVTTAPMAPAVRPTNPPTSVTQRYPQNGAPPTTHLPPRAPAWTNFGNKPPPTNHNGSLPNASFQPSNPGTNSNAQLPKNGSIPPLMPPKPESNVGEGNRLPPISSNSIDILSNQGSDSSSYSSVLSSSFEEANKQPTEAGNSRAERRQFIQQGLQFLQSPRPWAGTPEEYAEFLNRIKQMLLQESRELRKEFARSDSVQRLSEALNMCKYMESEGIEGHNTDIVTLLVERSAVLLDMGRVPPALEDANKALQLCDGSSQDAIRCKAKAFIKAGTPMEAYDMLMQFSRRHNLDKESMELANNLSQMLNLRARKPYQPFGTFNAVPPLANDSAVPDRLNFAKPEANHTNNGAPPLNSPMGNFGNPSNNPSLSSYPGSYLPQNGNPMQNFSTRPPQNMPGFNKTPGTSLHGFPPFERQPLAPDSVVNGGMPQKSPLGVRGFGHPFSGFQTLPSEPIADSLRQNLEMMTGDTQTHSLFGQGSSLRRAADTSTDLVSGMQSLAVGQHLNENGLGPDLHRPSIATESQGSKMWDYMSGKVNNNNNVIGGTGQSFSHGLAASIGYRKPFSSPGMGGDAPSLLSLPSNGSGSSCYHPAFDSADGIGKFQGGLPNGIKASGSIQDQGFRPPGANTIMGPSGPFGVIGSSTGDQAGFSHVGPSYSHFPQSSGHPAGLSQLFGPNAIGIGIPDNQQQVQPQQTQPSAASVVSTVKTYSEQSEDSLDLISPDEDDTLDSYLRNPLHSTHEFRLGCSDCVIKTGSKVTDYRYDEHLNHACYKNMLLCRRRDSADWHKIRPRPQPQSRAQLYDGPYYICKDLLAGADCTYPVVCTFAYNQEEIDLWTLERKQMLNRRWLFDSLDEDYMRDLSPGGRVLCKHRGLFDFLCRACFTNKPRIISTFNLGSGTCINVDAGHEDTPDNRQLTHILRDTAVRYTAIRVPAQQAILCRHEVRFQCTREEDCHFAHSLVERDVWALMIKKGLTPDQIVEQSREYVVKLNNSTNTLDQSLAQTSELGVPMFRWKVKFICSLCYKNGQISEATKDRKYCLARAQHSWATNKKTVLVQTIRKDWTQIRDLPYLKNKALPTRFELCENIRRQKKCPFSAKCNFAHSQEELDIWIYIRENQLKDLEDLHDSLNREKSMNVTAPTKSPPPNLQSTDPNVIRLPTDFLPQSAYHCWLCNKECNGQRQWEKHCLSVKHRLGALSDNDGIWKYRNPGEHYEMCERHLKNICEYDYVPPSDNKCRFAHSVEELEEWKQRREYVLNRIKKAQNDQLISAADNMDILIKESQQHLH